MKQNETNLVPKSSKKFRCEKCDYTTSRKSQYDRHLTTAKHQNETFETKMKQKGSKKFQCLCGVNFNSRTTLWRHQKICDCNLITSSMITPELVIELINNNKEMKQIIQDQHITMHNTVSNTNCNNVTTNNAFNLNFFLNETCKNAMNITDFVSSIKLNLEDLENTGRQGYVQGITNIIIKNLNNLEYHMRPLHCSDAKREVLYIKDNNEWTKETDNKPILTRAIKTIANENIKQISKWKDNYPDCVKSDSKKNDLYLKIVSNSMNGLTKEEGDKNIHKIINNIVKEVVIDKT